MAYDILIDAGALSPHINDANWAVVDCRFSLNDTERGRLDYLKAHIPGAVYAHMEQDLSGKKVPGKTGRHPLPEKSKLIETLSAWGIDASTQVVAYDDAAGSMAVRLWWLLNWMGHRNVAVLDGGWQSWTASGMPARGGLEQRRSSRFAPHEIRGAQVGAEEVRGFCSDPHHVILDARSGPRFRGEVEPIDPVAGHIPGAISAPWEENVTPDGRFLPPEVLRRRYEKLVKSVPPENVICYCGSGITAAHNIIAIAYAGLGTPRLYGGSWSDWINDPSRPIAKGEEKSIQRQ